MARLEGVSVAPKTSFVRWTGVGGSPFATVCFGTAWWHSWTLTWRALAHGDDVLGVTTQSRPLTLSAVDRVVELWAEEIVHRLWEAAIAVPRPDGSRPAPVPGHPLVDLIEIQIVHQSDSRLPHSAHVTLSARATRKFGLALHRHYRDGWVPSHLIEPAQRLHGTGGRLREGFWDRYVSKTGDIAELGDRIGALATDVIASVPHLGAIADRLNDSIWEAVERPSPAVRAAARNLARVERMGRAAGHPEGR